MALGLRGQRHKPEATTLMPVGDTRNLVWEVADVAQQ